MQDHTLGNVYSQLFSWLFWTFCLRTVFRNGVSRISTTSGQPQCPSIGLPKLPPLICPGKSSPPLDPIHRMLTLLGDQTWGITISSTILQNELHKKLPAAFIAQFPSGLEIAYAAIPRIHLLPEPLRTEVRVAFADSMSMIWKVMIGISGLGILALFLLQEIEMNNHTDTSYGLDEKKGSEDPEIAEITQ